MWPQLYEHRSFLASIAPVTHRFQGQSRLSCTKLPPQKRPAQQAKGIYYTKGFTDCNNSTARPYMQGLEKKLEVIVCYG